MPEKIAAALLDAARTIRVDKDADTVLSDVAHAATTLPGIDHAGVTLLRGGKYETRATTSPLVRTLDDLQYTLGEGPCVTAMESVPSLVAVNYLRHDQRWQAFVPQAVRLGVRAQIGIGLVCSELKVGGLNLYSTVTEEIDPDVVRLVELLAVPAAFALGFVHREEQFVRAISSRTLIGQAVGVVMSEFTLDAEQAFAYLKRVSSESNTKLRDVAGDIVQRSTDRAREQTNAHDT